MKRFLAMMVVGLFAAPAAAQAPWYARGAFNNGWLPATRCNAADISWAANHYTTTIAGLFDNTTFEFKIASLNWDTSVPGSNGKVTTNAAGEITFHYMGPNDLDGWMASEQSSAASVTTIRSNTAGN